MHDNNTSWWPRKPVAAAWERAGLPLPLIMFQGGLSILHLIVVLLKVFSLLETTQVSHLVIGYNFSDLCRKGVDRHAGRQACRELVEPPWFSSCLQRLWTVARIITPRVPWILGHPADFSAHVGDCAYLACFEKSKRQAEEMVIQVFVPPLQGLYKPDGVHLSADLCLNELGNILHDIAASVADYDGADTLDDTPDLEHLDYDIVVPGKNPMCELLVGTQRANGKDVPVAINGCIFSVHPQVGLWCSMCGTRATSEHLSSHSHISNADLYYHIFGRHSLSAPWEDFLLAHPTIGQRQMQFSPAQLQALAAAESKGGLHLAQSVEVVSIVKGNLVEEMLRGLL